MTKVLAGLTPIFLKSATVCGTDIPHPATVLLLSPLQSPNLFEIGEGDATPSLAFLTCSDIIGAPILQCSEVVTGDGTKVFDVSGVFFSICPVEGSYSRKLFSGTAGTIKCLICQSTIDKIGATGRSKTACGDTGNTIDAVDAFVETSAMLQKRFKKKCNEALTSQKIGKRSVFSAVGIHITVCS